MLSLSERLEQDTLSNSTLAVTNYARPLTQHAKQRRQHDERTGRRGSGDP